MHPAVRSRVLADFLMKSGVKEPEDKHISGVEALVFSEKPSARASFPGDIVVERCYDTLRALPQAPQEGILQLTIPGEYRWGQWRIRCQEATEVCNTALIFTVAVQGQVCLRSRQDI